MNDRRAIGEIPTVVEPLLIHIRELAARYGLTETESDTMIAFRGESDFYLFWISVRRSVLTFTARRSFTFSRKRNLVRFPLAPPKKEEITAAIAHICQDYHQKEAAPKDLPAEERFAKEATPAFDLLLSHLRDHVAAHGDSYITCERVGGRAFRSLQACGILCDSVLASHTLEELREKVGMDFPARTVARYIRARLTGMEALADPPEGERELARFSALCERLTATAREDPHEVAARLTLAPDALAAIRASLEKALTEFLYAVAAPLNEREKTIFFLYHGDDRITLADIAPQYQVTRERIRQLSKRAQRRLTGSLNRLFSLGCPPQGHLHAVCDACQAAGDDAAVLWALLTPSPAFSRISAFLLPRLFPSEIHEDGIRLATALQNAHCRRERERKAATACKNAWESLAQRITFPSERRFVTTPQPPSYPEEIRTRCTERLGNEFSKLAPLVTVVKTPDIVYYTSSQSEHRPHFLLITPEGCYVLVLAMPHSHMPIHYNRARCNALHCFCRDHGYGYLITDDRGHSIHDLMQMPTPEEAVGELHRLLKEKGMVTWEDIKELRRTHPLDSLTLSAILMQERLRFSLSPFRILPRR